MRMFKFHNPLNHHFAEAGRRGSWFPDSSSGTCSGCGISQQKRIPPLVIEWLPGSDIVGDFVWPGGDIAITQRVKEGLQKNFDGVDFKSVEMWQDPELTPPRRVTKRTKPRVWLPYSGPPLYEMWTTSQTHIDFQHSSVRLDQECPICGSKKYNVDGIEKRMSRWNSEKKELDNIHTPRGDGKGIYVSQKNLQDVDIFRVIEMPAWVLCTERVRKFIRKQKFSNISFLEVGEIF